MRGSRATGSPCCVWPSSYPDSMPSCCRHLQEAEAVSPASFLALDAIGSLIYPASMWGSGMSSPEQLEIAVGWAKHLELPWPYAIGVPSCSYIGWRGLILIRMIRQLRVRFSSVRECCIANQDPAASSRCSTSRISRTKPSRKRPEVKARRQFQVHSALIPHGCGIHFTDYRTRRCRDRSLLFFAARNRERTGSDCIEANRRGERLGTGSAGLDNWRARKVFLFFSFPEARRELSRRDLESGCPMCNRSTPPPFILLAFVGCMKRTELDATFTSAMWGRPRSCPSRGKEHRYSYL